MDLREQKDAELSEILDTIDLAYVISEGIKQTVSAVDWTEGVEPFVYSD